MKLTITVNTEYQEIGKESQSLAKREVVVSISDSIVKNFKGGFATVAELMLQEALGEYFARVDKIKGEK